MARRLYGAGPDGVPTATMALPFGDTPGARDKRSLAILAKTIYRELRSSGYDARDVMALAAELLAQVTRDVRSGNEGAGGDGGTGPSKGQQ